MSWQDRTHWFGIDSLQASVRLTSIADEIVPIGSALIVYKLVFVLTSIADGMVPVGLVLMVYKLVFVFTSIADGMVAVGLVLMVYKLVFVLTSIADGMVPVGLVLIVYWICPGFDIDSLHAFFHPFHSQFFISRYPSLFIFSL